MKTLLAIVILSLFGLGCTSSDLCTRALANAESFSESCRGAAAGSTAVSACYEQTSELMAEAQGFCRVTPERESVSARGAVFPRKVYKAGGEGPHGGREQIR